MGKLDWIAGLSIAGALTLAVVYEIYSESQDPCDTALFRSGYTAGFDEGYRCGHSDGCSMVRNYRQDEGEGGVR